MEVTRPRATKISQITIDADLDMGAHTLKADTVAGSTSDAVTIAGVILKDLLVIAYDYLSRWNVSRAVILQTFSVIAQETSTGDIFFKPDGAKMYIVGHEAGEVNEYDLSTPWDVSTAVWLQLFSVAAEEITPRGVFFKPDGAKMYIAGNAGVDVNEYDLGVAWSVISAVYLQNFSVAGEETVPLGIFFKPDGAKMYIVGSEAGEVNEYDLGTPWDVSSAVWLQLFSVAAEETSPNGVFFKPGGAKMYIVGSEHGEVNEYDLSTPWDVSSAVWLQLFSVAAEETSPGGVFFKPDGAKMYIAGTENDEVNEYDLYV